MPLLFKGVFASPLTRYHDFTDFISSLILSTASRTIDAPSTGIVRLANGSSRARTICAHIYIRRPCTTRGGFRVLASTAPSHSSHIQISPYTSSRVPAALAWTDGISTRLPLDSTVAVSLARQGAARLRDPPPPSHHQ